MSEPIAQVDDVTDVQLWDHRAGEHITRIGTVVEVHDGGFYEHQYTMMINGYRHRVAESKIATPTNRITDDF